MIDGDRPNRALTAASYAVVLVLAVELALWGAFLVPLRLFGVPFPAGPMIALVGNAAVGYAGMRVLRSRLGAVIPAVLWLTIALTAGSRVRGDLVLPGSPMSLAFLLVGTVAAIVVVGFSPSPASRVSR